MPPMLRYPRDLREQILIEQELHGIRYSSLPGVFGS